MGKNNEEEELIKFAIGFRDRKLAIVVFFTLLLAIPFAFAIYNYESLKTCQANPSPNCPKLFINNPDGTVSNRNTVDLSSNKLITN
mgnify:CR=1 FL=1